MSSMIERIKANQHEVDQKKLRLGKMGEICVGNWASISGKVVIHAIDPYDSQKDLIIDGATVEVKTQIPYINERAFTISPNQLKKCRGVDQLYFIALPSPQARFAYDGQCWIYQVNPKTFVSRTKVTPNSNLQRILIDIDQEAVVAVKEIDASDINQMMKYHTG